MTETNNVTQPQEAKPITSIDQINNIIRKRDIAYASHFMVPSLKREVPFNEINTSQQKRLVKSVIDSPVYNTEFIYTLREILKENCQDSTIDVDSLSIIDKLVLALALRAKSIGNMVDIEIETKEIDPRTKQPIKVTTHLDISNILEVALKTLSDIAPFTTEDAYYRVECMVPTVGVEYKLERELRNKVTSIQIENVDELRKTVGEAFIGEIVKYVRNVWIKSEDDTLIPLDWKSFNFADRIKIAETFKSILLREVLNYINGVRKEVDKIELVNFEFGGEPYTRRLSIDGNFFTIS
jgi:hypothetical protein